RIAPVAGRAVAHATLADGERVLDVGTGTGKIMELAAPQVGPNGHVLGVDISPEMLAYAQRMAWTMSACAKVEPRRSLLTTTLST
ncbi:MAG: hypothetical protein CL702_11575, partial [Chloroflexi bacterium]|nr:hypothetical protein [Chloroflexota bacterium]